ncbi:zinc-binding dehydrogenase [candidate division KSB1 bacterium]|nr:zinc-binding dehydrogenase [candidate division KSB1 bacterium]
MKQVVQNLKNGDMKILEVPYPVLQHGCVLIRNHYSVVSPGTESRSVRDARANLIKKAQSRPDQVEKILQSIRTNGLLSTFKIVTDKLDSWSPLGYSCAGRVIDVGNGVDDIAIGDYVACGGNGAVHAEVVCVSRNLVVKTSKNKLRESAFTTLGAIALQGIRQADLRVGETAVVIGLGLVGLLTVMLLKTAGIRVIALDKMKSRVETAVKIGADRAFQRHEANLTAEIERFSGSIGCDAAIITAGSNSTDPVDLAGELCRQKAIVVVVGNVNTGFSRPNYYKKELDLRMSCSYGPGRYDKTYEQKNCDYPVGYVRWTENRNMQAFIDFLHQDQIDVNPLIGREIPFDQAKTAYELLLKKSNNAMVFSYNRTKSLSSKVAFASVKTRKQEPVIGVIGAGSFARNYLLPSMAKTARLRGLVTASPHNARTVAEKYGFAYCSHDENDLLHDATINTVFILTQHHLHAGLVIKALHAGKHVFVEKPLCMNEIELEKIISARQQGKIHCRVGYNRRFAPLITEIKKRLPRHLPKAIHYRINAGPVSPDSWIQDPEIGGGRIIGEVCHFVDLLCFLTGSRVKSLFARSMDNKTTLADTLCITFGFADGSTANISYFSNGNKKCEKEYLEIFSGGDIHVLKDFYHYRHYGTRKTTKKRSSAAKGHKEEIQAFTSAIRQGDSSGTLFEEIVHSSRITFHIIESLKTQKQITFDT